MITLANPPSAASQRPVRARRTRRSARVLAGLALLALLAVGATAGWLAVGDDANADDLASALATYDIRVSQDGPTLTVASSGAAAQDIGIVFLPGTRIEPAAYVATWAPIVEATGVSVHIPAMPLNLPALESGHIEDVIAANSTTSTWIVGGHSMGGFEAAEHVATTAARPAGLLLWGSGPARTDLAEVVIPTLLVAGGADTVLPLDRALREGSLPVDATIEVIDGMVHGQFGRYSDTGTQQDPTVRSDADTLTDLAGDTASFIQQVATQATR